MTEGHDGDDDRALDDEGDESRDRDEQSETDWDQQWPSETRSDDTKRTTRQGETDERSESDSHTEGTSPQESHTAGTSPQHEERPRSDRVQGQSGGSYGETDDRISAGSDVGSGFKERVVITDEARDDGNWIDLGAKTPRGEALAAGDLSEEKLQEYTTKRRSLNPLVQIHWGIRVTIGALIIGLITTWGLGALDINQQIGGAVLGGLVLLGLLWVALYYRLWVYQIRADAIYLERGVATHVRTLVPYVRIQHVDTSRSPIERMLGLSTLVVYTAGSRGADVSIPGLQPEEARDLQRRVKELAIEAEGDDAL